jgi:hypothetical protein
MKPKVITDLEEKMFRTKMLEWKDKYPLGYQVFFGKYADITEALGDMKLWDKKVAQIEQILKS